MANSYTISTTDGETQVTITAGAVNGNITGAVGNDTDLILYGRGSFNWGQGIEQNLIRLTENWATESNVHGASVNAQVPKDYNGTPNKGITSPIVGQNWFNKTNNRPYVYTSTGWQNDAAKHGVQLDPASAGAQVIKSDLKLSTGSPDLYISSTTADLGENAHIILQGTADHGGTVNTAVLFSSHGKGSNDPHNENSDAVYLRKFATRSYDSYDGNGLITGYLPQSVLDIGGNETATGDASAIAAGRYGFTANENKIGNASNQIKMTDFETIFSRNLRAPYIDSADVAMLGGEVLTTKRVVNYMLEDYVPMSGTRAFNDFPTGAAAGSYMTGNIGIQARAQSSNPNSHARLIMGFTGTTTTDTGFVTLQGHNPRFLATSNHNGLESEAMYALGMDESIKARMFIKRGHWDSVKFAGADPELHNPDNLKEWFAPPDPANTNPVDPPENKYGIKSTQDTLGILKYNDFITPDNATIANGFIIFDKWIETIKDVGLIRTTTPTFNYTGDDPDYDRTLATIQSVKNYVGQQISGGTGSFYTEGDNLTIDEGATARLQLTGLTSSQVRLGTSNGEAEYGAVSFHASDSVSDATLRGRIAVDSGNSSSTDKLVLQKWTGTTGPQNSLEVQYNQTHSMQKIDVGDGGNSGSIVLNESAGGVPFNSTNFDSGAFVDDHAFGLIFKSNNGGNRAGILSDMNSSLFFYPPSGNQSGATLPYMSMSTTEMQIHNMELKSGAGNTPGTDYIVDPNSNNYAHERMLYRLTNRLVQQEQITNSLLDSDGAGNTGWHAATGINATLTPQNAIGKFTDEIEFDFSSTDDGWFTQDFASYLGHTHRCRVEYNIDFMFSNTAISAVADEANTCTVFFRVGTTFAAADTNSTIGWSSFNLNSRFNLSRADTFPVGRLAGTELFPMSGGNKIQIRFASNFGPVQGFNTIYNKVFIKQATFTGSVI